MIIHIIQYVYDLHPSYANQKYILNKIYKYIHVKIYKFPVELFKSFVETQKLSTFLQHTTSIPNPNLWVGYPKLVYRQV